MKKYLFHSLMTVALWAMSMPVMAEDCSILKGAAQILYQQQRWDIVKMECETYLKQCGYDAEIQKMLDDCNRHLNGSQTKPADKPQPKETPKETPKQSPKPAAQPAPKPQPQPVAQPAPSPAVEEEEEVLNLFGNPSPAPQQAPQQNKSGKSSKPAQPVQPVEEEPLFTPAPTYNTPASTPSAGGFGVELVEEDDAAPAPTYTPEPAKPTYTPEPAKPTYTPEPVFIPEPEPEPEPAKPTYTPEPVFIPEPEPEPEPLILPEPTPEPVQVVVAEPEPVKQPETVIKDEEPVYIPKPVERPRTEIIFRVSKSFLEFPERGGEAQVTVTADEGWKVTESPSWVNAQRKGNNVEIKVAANERFTAREGDIVLTNDNHVELRVVVAQERNSDYMNLSAQLIDDTEGDGGRYTIKVNSNKAWKTNTLPGWCTTEANGENLVIRLSANKSGVTRQTEIEVTAINSVLPKQVITVKQSPIHNYIVVSPNIITSSGRSSIATVKVESDQTEYRVEGLPYWCSVKQQTPTSFIVEIADNSGGDKREAQANVTVAGGKSDILIIRQEERLNYISVSPKIITASARGGIITVNVKSSGPWRVVNMPDWCQVTEETDNSFTLSIGENKTGAPRRVSFSVSTGGVRESIEVKQE